MRTDRGIRFPVHAGLPAHAGLAVTCVAVFLGGPGAGLALALGSAAFLLLRRSSSTRDR